MDPEEYARDNLKFRLVEVVYEWENVHISRFTGTHLQEVCTLRGRRSGDTGEAPSGTAGGGGSCRRGKGREWISLEEEKSSSREGQNRGAVLAKPTENGACLQISRLTPNLNSSGIAMSAFLPLPAFSRPALLVFSPFCILDRARASAAGHSAGGGGRSQLLDATAGVRGGRGGAGADEVIRDGYPGGAAEASVALLLLLALSMLSLPMGSDDQAGCGLSHPRPGLEMRGEKGEPWMEMLSWEPRTFLCHNFLVRSVLPIVLLGCGEVGSHLLRHIVTCRPLYANQGVAIWVVGVTDSSSLLVADDFHSSGHDDTLLADLCIAKSSGAPLSSLLARSGLQLIALI
ncbi:hypothetical protein GUJ93_ZPchr0008g11566 [Zizania palustris]|uniref:Uncharacterized protein n=1 Tax=Zizania palustris TaxID=103762 RepID=A0A8J5UX31_ZIZPA|nr:hypothetical protein GUJ93_ZPchr0008g11566 [Zizania palustris]